MQPHPQIRALIWQCKFLLRTASLLVPKPQRAEWYREWYGEVWHWLHFLAESGRLNAQTSMELARHCWGAFPDAAWHRFDHKKVTRALDEVPRTARFCLGAILVAVLGLCLSPDWHPPFVRDSSPCRSAQPDRLALPLLARKFYEIRRSKLCSVKPRQWAERSKTAEMVAAYSWHPVSLSLPMTRCNDISARVSPNFFDLLGNKPRWAGSLRRAMRRVARGCVVITHRLWERAIQFRSQHRGQDDLSGRPRRAP